MMRSLSILVWLMVGLQIALLGVSGGDPLVWAGFAITLAAAVYVTTVAGGR